MVPIELSPEQELLLCCARTRLEGRQRERAMEVLHRGIDWDRVLLTADHHKVTGLLARHLTGACAGLVPPAVRDRLAVSAAQIARRNLALASELCRILSLFMAQGITAVPYKGPVLALQAYGNLGLRQSVDLDVFVQREDVLPAKRILLAEGYRLNFDLSSAQQATVLRSEYALEFAHPEKRIPLELHWDIGRSYFSFPLKAISLWDRLQGVSVGGSEIPSPSWDDHVLLVCAHSSKHCWDRLMWISDVAELLREAPASGLAPVLERAHELGALRMVLLGLFLAHRLLDVDLPEDAVRQLERDRAVSLLATGVIARLFAAAPQAPSLLDQVRFHLSVRERLRDRVRYCVQDMVTPTVLDALWLPLPMILSPLYLVARPARLLKRHLFRIRLSLSLILVWLLSQCATPPPPPSMNPDMPTEIVALHPPKDDPEQAHRPRTTCPPGMAGSC